MREKHFKKETDIMYGAILGDIIGSPYEFDMGDKTKDFPLFSARAQFTDDTVMTVAVAEALLDSRVSVRRLTLRIMLSPPGFWVYYVLF